MGDRHDYVALDWVKGEISETLNQARQALEAFVENPGDSTRLRFCLTYIHQVHGTLQMVEFYGAALLAEEMEKLAQALMHGAVSRENEALDVLMQGILQLPTYLDRVQSGRRDLPLVLLPLLNDMRTARGEKLLSENALFSPDVDTGNPIDESERLTNFNDEHTIWQLRKLRQAMQVSQAAIIRSQDVEVNARQLGKGYGRLQSLCQGSAYADLWAAFAGVVEGIEHGTIDNGAAIRQLLRQGDREVRSLLEQGAAALDNPPAPELLRNLLFYVAKSPGGSVRLDALKQRYQLKALLTEDDIANQATGSRLVGPDRSAMKSVVDALGEELLQVKDQLDLFVRSDRQQLDGLASLAPAIKQIADTLAMLGLGQQRRVLLEQVDLVEQMVGGRSAVNDGGLMDIAGALLYVEASLQGILGIERSDNSAANSDMQRLAAAQDMTLVHQQVVQEARNALEQTREAINAFIASQWDHSQLEPVSDLLNSVRGGLAMLPLERAATTIGACRRYINQELLEPRKVPGWVELDALADVITSVDYYLERLAEDDAERSDNILTVAEDRLATLGYGLNGQPARTDSVQPVEDELGDAAADVELDELADALDDTVENEEPEILAFDSPDLTLELDEATDDMSDQAELPPVIEVEEEPLLELDEPSFAESEEPDSDNTVEFESDSIEQGLSTEEDAPVADMPQPTAAAIEDEDEDELDEELIEIFVEEAGEVLDTLTEYTPLWQADAEDHKSRAEVRRAFHTLKGSGRMVKASVLAELAWSVENMLNRVIDRSIELTPSIFEVMNAVRGLMPQLVEDFSQGQQHMLPEVERLSRLADALSQGESIEDLAELAEPESSAAEQNEELLEEPITGEEIEEVPLADLPTDEPDRALPEDEQADADETDAATEWDTLGELPVVEVEDQEPVAESLESEQEAVAEQPEAQSFEVGVSPEIAAEGGLDPILLDIFRNETQSHIEQINAFISQCQQALPRPISDALQRALHTLKGSAHMAGIQPIAVVATPLERLAKDFKANLVPAEQPLVDLLSEAVEMIEAGIVQLEHAPELALPGTESFLARVEALREAGLAARHSSRSDLDEGSVGNAGLLSIFLTEGIDLLMDAADLLDSCEPGDLSVIDLRDMRQSLRALGEVAAEVDLQPIEGLCQALEDVYEAVSSTSIDADQTVIDALSVGHERLIGMMDQVAAHQHIASAANELAALQALLPRPVISAPSAPAATSVVAASAPAALAGGTWNPGDAGTDAELVEIFLEEAQEIIDSASASLQKWLSDTGNTLAVESLQRDLHTLKGGARMAEIPPVGDLAHELEFLYEGLCAQRYEPSEGLSELLHACHDSLADMVEGVIAGRPISDGSGLINSIKGYRANPHLPPQLPGSPEAAHTDMVPTSVAEQANTAEQAEQSAAPSDDPLLGMFLEEARELLSPCPELLLQSAEDSASAADLLHRIQTLKGSARMAGQAALANSARDLEAGLQTGRDPQMLGAQLQALMAGIEQLGQGVSDAPANWNMPQVQPAVAAAPVVDASRQTLAQVKQILQQAMQSGETAEEAANQRVSGQETVKVPAKLLEELVNLAGETSIFRGRVEQQVSDLGATLNDMDSTIERVRDQLRRLDMETQAQILSRHQDEIAQQGYEDFDPLEMDQYSQLQQLSRSLFESASDLMDLKETIAAKSRDAETLLLQQARVNTELQEGLMRTRMVPFDRLLPRMRRVVRQVAGELGKQVALDIGSAEGEMDRSVLERMIGPLEHMLRNAVDHGIEMPDLRSTRGKGVEGKIRLDLHREGGEIVLTLSDDGAGINLEAVRRKAIERGLMDADADLTDQEVLQFILEAGFSTADKVTQISGRGVGMDVVNAEVKQLGGSMSLDTRPGEGSTFSIRLPFTVSVNRALMVYSGDDLYAIPLNTIEGIVRVSGYELEAYYSPDAPPFEYAGKRYDLRYLGDLLVTGQQPRLSGHSLPLPVILVRGADHTVAVQVDSLAGSREIVVKGLGKQFAVVPGISGATILGDGRVVVILDLLAVIRAQQALQSQQRLAAERAQAAIELADERPTLVMVVDDSITVRKVTTRLLERHGMEVITAKDGVEAIARLQDIHPDIMLLDIEMPRMDGFEVATLVRHDQRLKDLPIIMITSRTGEKHRDRARSIGVNDYLGKPYQESQLLEAIGNLVKVRD
ncbi:MAG: hybrid sensor histidine kinase/response regulator [Gammaproteobacteria bacterium HGW-Gammaproteobacteria-11]|nr:MAG: hybrid sensor histidine kinase/response regulator [Gammaproteobacteria bacterium HGW-Gammaproteobacteria-11]